MKTNNIKVPETGLIGLKQNWKVDMLSGFLVFLLALPLSLGIAKASGFPAAMGVLTAMIGGLFVSFFKVSQLTIKGPAAGLITVCAASIVAMGGGDIGWHATGAIIVTMAIIQIIFAYLKFGSFSDFFPHSAVHGMLAAIGLIIIAKQIPVLLGDDPMTYKGEGPVELFMDIPRFIQGAHWHIALIGVISLVILFGLPMLKLNFLKKVPAPMLVLILAIPLAISMHFRQEEPGYSLVSVGSFWDAIRIQPDFSGIATFPYWKYVFMFLFVNSLESLLTVKAIDNLDPFRRESDYNGDLKALGAGNAVSGLLGGLPMISEVVRSSANVNFGARTKWSNFFHGIFLFLAMLLMIPVIEMIPNTALAAMLIYAGYRLAAPKEFFNTYKIGKEQLAIFLVTIFVTLFEDLLLGVASGILVKFLFHLYNGAPLASLFKAKYVVEQNNSGSIIKVSGSAVFSNLLGYKKVLHNLPEGAKVTIDFSATRLVDHSFMHFIHHFEREYKHRGGNFSIIGLDDHTSLSDHDLATRKLKPSAK